MSPEEKIADDAHEPTGAELAWNECTDIANEAQMITGRSIWPSTVQAIAKVMRSRALRANQGGAEG